MSGYAYDPEIAPIVPMLPVESDWSDIAAARRSMEELVANLIGSLGAGIYEELLFRLLLLSLLSWFFFRVTEAFSVPSWYQRIWTSPL